MATHSNADMNSVSGATGGVPSGLVIVDMQDWHKHVQLDDTPILDMITKDGAAPSVPIDKATWGWSEVTPRVTTLAEALDDSETDIDVAAGTGVYFQIGSLIEFTSGEICRVTGIATDTLTVVRGFAGTTAAVQASGSGVHILAPAYAEYGTYQASPFTQGTTDYNYHQQMLFEIEFSHRAQVIPTYESREFGDDRARWAAQQITESTMPQNLESLLVRNTVRQQGTTSLSGVMGGIRTSSFIGTIDTSLGGVPLTPKILLDFIEDMINASSEPIGRDIVCHQKVARYIYSWFHEMRQMDAGSTGKVATYTKQIDTPYGIFNVVPVRTWTKPGAAGASDPLNQILIANLKDYKLTPLSSKSTWKLYYRQEADLDYWGGSARMRGDYTLRAGNPYTKGLLGGFSTTDAHYPAMI